MTRDATASAFHPLPRAENIPADYSAGWHAARTLTLALGFAALGVYLARGATAIDLVFLPLFFFAANGIEYAVHRGPMHHPRPPRILYKNHTLIHHRAFLHDQMEVKDTRELYLIMMPWYTMLMLFVIASPIALVGYVLRGPAVAGLFYLTAAGYFLLYETLHALYHMPAPVLARLHLGGRLFTAMQLHHRQHHRLDRMTFTNFNVTLPLWDWIIGTNEPYGETKKREPHVESNQPA